MSKKRSELSAHIHSLLAQGYYVWQIAEMLKMSEAKVVSYITNK